MSSSTLSDAPPSAPPSPPIGPERQVTWRRLRSPVALGAIAAVCVASIGATAGTVFAGRVAEDPAGGLIGVLALCLLGSAVIESAGKLAWVAEVDRAEGRLRDDVLQAAMRQPLGALTEQAVGEILDRVDDDTHEIGNLSRWQLWSLFRTVASSLPMWIVAAASWWPAAFLFPALALVTWFAIRRLLGEIARRKVIEEIAWTDQAAALEEGIAGRDDLRTSLGQSHVTARLARLSAVIHARFHAVIRVESRLARRAGVLLHALLAAIAVAGVALTVDGSMSVARLVTLFLVTSMFVGQVAQLAEQLPDLQAGMGAIIRIRTMLAAPPEPEGGDEFPSASGSASGVEIDIRGLDFAYAEGAFALRGIDLTIPAGHTVALVGRTGSGKSTLASLLSRAVDPPPGTVFVGGRDITTIDLQRVRSRVGVVTQRTEILIGSLADNIALFDPAVTRERIDAAIDRLGLRGWVDGLPAALDSRLGPGGTTLSAGEEQLVAFCRLMVREVDVVVLDEATARMDPLTERLVIAASDRLLAGRTGILIAHRLTTIERAGLVAVLDGGRIVQQGPRDDLIAAPGPFATLLAASRTDGAVPDGAVAPPVPASGSDHVPASTPTATPPGSAVTAVGGRRRTGPPPALREIGDGPSLTRGIVHALLVAPAWGVLGAILFLLAALTGAQGAITGLLWGETVQAVGAGERPGWLLLGVVISLLVAPVAIAEAFRRYPRWWIEVMLRVRMAVLQGQTHPRRLVRTPAGEVVARAMDADRFARYADRWVDFGNGVLIAAATAVLGGTWLAGAVLLVVLVASAVASSVGRPIAGRSAAAASSARARFGRALVSALESVRTVKLAATTPSVLAHLRRVDAGRVDAAVTEHRVQAVLEGVPVVMVSGGVVAAWAAYSGGLWELSTALLVANAVSGFGWFGRVAGSVVTEAPGTRAWQAETSRFAGGVDLMTMAPGVDLVAGTAPRPADPPRVPLSELALRDLSAVHDDGTVGVEHVDLRVSAGELVLLVGQVGSGKSSLLAALAGLVSHRGEILWNGRLVTDPEVFLRPGQVAYIAQVPRVLSGTFADNVRLGHQRAFDGPVADARLGSDVAAAGGRDAVVGHRGVRLSGGQVQRLALARALATDAELLLADDVSSALDATTEIELWEALRGRRATVIGATSKRAALARADRVAVLVDGRIVAVGPWAELARDWGSLAG
ncbi:MULTISPECIES: ATP-binding cassette domain-containing protein [Tsukamurella]|uniref:ABC transporter ATP-binding protein n=2 Tax=Tsukamurella TaxID=2060 RepID=A0A5C5S4P6_9ACTN|nr:MULTISPECIES: ABC transporter ATP-binding protein [Tsukamurella]NMD55724.1 ABC transporter ATP-binding protein [Tsukamurella columbiensis]TWS30417.1 ABC transporter ATP-binding protein [Tsukamurella conjunctivitidis]